MRRLLCLTVVAAAVVLFTVRAHAEVLKHTVSPFTDSGEGTHAPGRGVGYDAAKTDRLKRDEMLSHAGRAKAAGAKEGRRARGYESRVKERTETHKKMHGGVDETYSQ